MLRCALGKLLHKPAHCAPWRFDSSALAAVGLKWAAGLPNLQTHRSYEVEPERRYVVAHPRSLPESHLQEGLSLIETATGLGCEPLLMQWMSSCVCQTRMYFTWCIANACSVMYFICCISSWCPASLQCMHALCIKACCVCRAHHIITGSRNAAVAGGAYLRAGQLRALWDLCAHVRATHVVLNFAATGAHLTRVHEALAQPPPAPHFPHDAQREGEPLASSAGVNDSFNDDGSADFGYERTTHETSDENGWKGEDVVVLDRTALILDVFSKHAATAEAQLQVRLAGPLPSAAVYAVPCTHRLPEAPACQGVISTSASYVSSAAVSMPSHAIPVRSACMVAELQVRASRLVRRRDAHGRLVLGVAGEATEIVSDRQRGSSGAGGGAQRGAGETELTRMRSKLNADIARVRCAACAYLCPTRPPFE